MVGNNDKELANVAAGSTDQFYPRAPEVPSTLGEYVRFDFQCLPLLHGICLPTPE